MKMEKITADLNFQANTAELEKVMYTIAENIATSLAHHHSCSDGCTHQATLHIRINDERTGVGTDWFFAQEEEAKSVDITKGFFDPWKDYTEDIVTADIVASEIKPPTEDDITEENGYDGPPLPLETLYCGYCDIHYNKETGEKIPLRSNRYNQQ